MGDRINSVLSDSLTVILSMMMGLGDYFMMVYNKIQAQVQGSEKTHLKERKDQFYQHDQVGKM
jgi:hypothetical protein